MAGNRAEFTKVLQVIYMLRVPYAFYLEGASKTLHNHTYILAYIRPSEPGKTYIRASFFFQKDPPCPDFYLISTLAGPFILQSSFPIWHPISRYRLRLQSECSSVFYI